MLSAQAITKSYVARGGQVREALQQTSIDVAQGEFLSVVGPSGCGKTTLLKICAGLVEPTSGQLSFRGSAGPVPPGMYGIVFQNAALLPWRRVVDNVVLPAIVLGRDVRAARKRALDLLTLLGLEGVAENYPRELSGGMQQRVAIARALLHDPPVLFMDEPFGALDALTREEVGLQFQEVQLQQERTVIFVTHSIQEAILLGDRVLVFSSSPGRPVADIRVDAPRPRSIDDATSARFREIEATIRQGLAKPPAAGSNHDRRGVAHAHT